MDLRTRILTMGDSAQRAAARLKLTTPQQRCEILRRMADAVASQRDEILAANAKDVAAGERNRLTRALLDRLKLTEERFDAMVAGIRQVAELPDPVGETIEAFSHQNGMRIERRRVPIGVIAIVYESRPNVTADAAVLCVKAGNAVILRGGSEALHSNVAIASALIQGGLATGMPEGAVQLIDTTDRDAVKELVQLEGRVDCVIPRGGEGLIRAVTEMARVPVIKHYKGVCHTYVDKSADLQMALDICENAKCQRPGVCNAMETLLVHEQIAPDLLPLLAERLARFPVELRGDVRAREIVPSIKVAHESDWYEEYLDYVLAVRVVPNVDVAVRHIEHYGSHHSDAIVAADEQAQHAFVAGVDSAAVYVNASTRFTDGSEFGMGAEIGISTDKLHARGPMGIRELTTYKFVITGSGQIRS